MYIFFNTNYFKSHVRKIILWPLFSQGHQWPLSSLRNSHWTLVGGHWGPTQWQKPQRGCISLLCPLPSHKSCTWILLLHQDWPRAGCRWSLNLPGWENWSNTKDRKWAHRGNLGCRGFCVSAFVKSMKAEISVTVWNHSYHCFQLCVYKQLSCSIFDDYKVIISVLHDCK